MSNIAKSAFIVMLVSVIAKVFGFIREIVLAGFYGVSSYSDAYITAANIPIVIFASIGTALATTFIPLFYEVRNESDNKEAMNFSNNVFNLVIIICMIIAILGFIFTDELVKLFAIGFTGETLIITVKLTKIFILGIIFTGLSYLMSSYLQIKNKFTIPSTIGIFKNIIIIISIILSFKMNLNIYILGYGTLIAMASEFIIQYPVAYKNGYRYKFHIDIKNKYIQKMMYLLIPVLIGVTVSQINTMIDRSIASTLVEGSISALNYANKLNQFIMAIFISSIATVMYPMLSKLSSENNNEKFNKTIVQVINSIIIIIIPVSVGAIVLASPIVKLLFQRGEFDSNATYMTSLALIFYSIGLIGVGLREILSRTFYCLKDTKTPMKNGIICMFINIVLNIILVKYMKHAGLAFATSISAISSIGILFVSLSKKIGYFGQDKIIKTTIKSIIASILMGVIVYNIHNKISKILGIGFINESISLTLAVILGVIAYVILVIILKVEDVRFIIKKIENKIVT
ncbi:murein biosynthesis integral membrane protein MurJ [Romboutsia timonensis]|uniref:murein biosynthesis integral membrane protein MurJ n=1 Tax=Romboutsia timonensis TaxID=1776391 RepID=UPI002A8005AF|nr:murein biosynthesis integral membrane protein MurJ [Romboutsia timonensis]MDY3959071.1 murein biosynthesis integral membrane protein MurJ [Romboutsia timonensis]